MKLFNIFSSPLNVTYKHQLCSLAFLFVVFVAAITILLPAFVVYMTNKEIWMAQLILYEQPQVTYEHEYLLVANFVSSEAMEEKVVVCSSYSKFSALDDLNADDCLSAEVRDLGLLMMLIFQNINYYR